MPKLAALSDDGGFARCWLPRRTSAARQMVAARDVPTSLMYIHLLITHPSTHTNVYTQQTPKRRDTFPTPLLDDIQYPDSSLARLPQHTDSSMLRVQADKPCGMHVEGVC